MNKNIEKVNNKDKVQYLIHKFNPWSLAEATLVKSKAKINKKNPYQYLLLVRGKRQ